MAIYKSFSETYFADALLRVDALMSGNGQEKYGPGLKERKLTDQKRSALNHLGRWSAGLDVDEESKALHLTAAAANLLIMLQHTITKPHLDDRPKSPVTGMKRDERGIPYTKEGKYPEYQEVMRTCKSGGPVVGE